MVNWSSLVQSRGLVWPFLSHTHSLTVLSEYYRWHWHPTMSVWMSKPPHLDICAISQSYKVEHLRVSLHQSPFSFQTTTDHVPHPSILARHAPTRRSRPRPRPRPRWGGHCAADRGERTPPGDGRGRQKSWSEGDVLMARVMNCISFIDIS